MGTFSMTDKSAEEMRVKSESGRVKAERGRVVAESNDETGRVEAEALRVGAETVREVNHATAVAKAEAMQAAFEEELKALRDDPDHYMTPGARRYFRRVAIGYIILAIGMSFGIKALSDNVDDNIRNDINEVAKQQCLGSIPTLNSFNSLVDSQIETYRSRRTLAEEQNDEALVQIMTTSIIELQESKIRVPVAKECDAPILK